jgi:hypothetical protein
MYKIALESLLRTLDVTGHLCHASSRQDNNSYTKS